MQCTHVFHSLRYYGRATKKGRGLIGKCDIVVKFVNVNN